MTESCLVDLHRISTALARHVQMGSLRWNRMSAPAPALPRTIVVVEDEASIAEAVATRLRSEGYEVETAETARSTEGWSTVAVL